MADFVRVKVLSWSIGRGSPARIRDEKVDVVVKKLKPEVLLLQEVPSKDIVEKLKGSQYSEAACINDGEKIDSLILYDHKVFKNASNEVHLKNVSIACLRHTIYNTEVTFMSYHNPHKSKGATELAHLFCDGVRFIGMINEIQIVAGADLNRTVKPHTSIPQYTLTGRQVPVDYFILHPPATNAIVSAEKIVDDDDENYDDITKALEHDPLLCQYPWPVDLSVLKRRDKEAFWEEKKKEIQEDLENKGKQKREVEDEVKRLIEKQKDVIKELRELRVED